MKTFVLKCSQRELGVLYSALVCYRFCQVGSLEAYLEASKITGFADSSLVSELKLSVNLIDKLTFKILSDKLIDSGSNQKPE